MMHTTVIPTTGVEPLMCEERGSVSLPMCREPATHLVSEIWSGAQADDSNAINKALSYMCYAHAQEFVDSNGASAAPFIRGPWIKADAGSES
jgi:hypothetical protein